NSSLENFILSNQCNTNKGQKSCLADRAFIVTLAPWVRRINVPLKQVKKYEACEEDLEMIRVLNSPRNKKGLNASDAADALIPSSFKPPPPVLQRLHDLEESLSCQGTLHSEMGLECPCRCWTCNLRFP
ncbi:hypothetical protein OS493_040263, partial [Desmophyllum pertusum]